MLRTKQNIQETIFFNGSNYFESLLHDLGQAQHSIDLEMYIFAQDTLGVRVIDALGKAAQRGVTVRVLVDGAGSPEWGGTIIEQLERSGVQTRVFHPFPWRFWQWSRAKIKKPFVQKIIYLCLHINTRNHRKVCTIDNKII